MLQLYVSDWRTGTSQAILPGPGPSPSSMLRFSGDSQSLVYNRVLNGTNQVYCYDFQTGANVLVSADPSGQPGYGNSDSPTASADGRFIVFHSAAPDLVSDDLNGQPDIFLHDRQKGVTSLLSKAALSTSSPNSRSLSPVFSRDGSTLLFASWGSDLASGDFNHSSDLFAYTFLTAAITPGISGQGPTVSWPRVPGRNYSVQFKDDLAEASWHDLRGTITNSGAKAFLQDASPASGQRFYRINSVQP